jgi:leader peptidase (prepilin peptidase)/N-methyltransferase
VSPSGLLLLTVCGLMIGSFLNVCIARIPAGESIVSPGSRCPSCRTPIRWYDNIPVVSYLALGGRCRQCRAPIGWRYPVVELVTAAAFLAQGLAVGDDPVRVAKGVTLSAMLIVLFGTDLDTQRLPNVITIPGIVLGLAFGIVTPPGLLESLAGAALGGAVLLGIRWGWKRATGVDGMGLGDVKMLAMIGAFLGWRQVWLVLFLASLAGAVVGLALTISRARSMQSRLPFGTFLALAAFASSLIGDQLLDWYLNFY